MLSNEAKLTISASSILVFQVFTGFAIGNVFLINRNRPPGLYQYWHSRDSFKIPSSICNRTSHASGGNECEPFDADFDSNQLCSCSCPDFRASFVFHDGEWACLANSKVRELQGKNTMAHKFNDFSILLRCSSVFRDLIIRLCSSAHLRVK